MTPMIVMTTRSSTNEKAEGFGDLESLEIWRQDVY